MDLLQSIASIIQIWFYFEQILLLKSSKSQNKTAVTSLVIISLL